MNIFYFIDLRHRQQGPLEFFIGVRGLRLVEEQVYYNDTKVCFLKPGWSPTRELATSTDARPQNTLATEANHRATPGPNMNIV